MKRVQRHTTESVRFDKRRGTWGYLWYEVGKRRSRVIAQSASPRPRPMPGDKLSGWASENRRRRTGSQCEKWSSGMKQSAA
jgi:hypothetical protein